MSFEEFLIKKKIDPVQLQSAEPSLFSEFRSHYSQMGEKSFDHSKKFWFNKLRRSYHLKEDPKVLKVPDEPNRLATQAEPLISPSIQATSYTPRFKSKIVPPAETTEKDIPEKPVYKPRFKPGMIKPTEKEE